MHCNGTERKCTRSTFYTCSTCLATQNLHFALLTDIKLTASDKTYYYLTPCRLNYLCICCVEIGSYLILNMLEGSSSMVLASSVQWCGASWSQWLAASLTIVNAPPPTSPPTPHPSYQVSSQPGPQFQLCRLPYHYISAVAILLFMLSMKEVWE